MIYEAIILLIALFAAHALCDYPLQGEFLSKFKNPNFPNELPDAPKWWLFLSMHCLIHSGAVLLLTGSITCAALEFTSHYVIDWLKCNNRITFTQDQLAHLAMKVLYVTLLAFTAIP